jgi:signal transduction histidine kinase
MPEGGELAIRTANTELSEGNPVGLPAGPYVQISITDRGKGMDPASARRVFDPAFAQDANDEETGLGLSIAEGVVRRHQGRITVWSEVGQGTRFEIYLPRAASSERLGRIGKTGV